LKLPHWAILVCLALLGAGKALEKSLPAPWSTVDSVFIYVLAAVMGGLGIYSPSANDKVQVQAVAEQKDAVAKVSAEVQRRSVPPPPKDSVPTA